MQCTIFTPFIYQRSPVVGGMWTMQNQFLKPHRGRRNSFTNEHIDALRKRAHAVKFKEARAPSIPPNRLEQRGCARSIPARAGVWGEGRKRRPAASNVQTSGEVQHGSSRRLHRKSSRSRNSSARNRSAALDRASKIRSNSRVGRRVLPRRRVSFEASPHR